MVICVFALLFSCNYDTDLEEEDVKIAAEALSQGIDSIFGTAATTSSSTTKGLSVEESWDIKLGDEEGDGAYVSGTLTTTGTCTLGGAEVVLDALLYVRDFKFLATIEDPDTGEITDYNVSITGGLQAKSTTTVKTNIIDISASVAQAFDFQNRTVEGEKDFYMTLTEADSGAEVFADKKMGFSVKLKWEASAVGATGAAEESYSARYSVNGKTYREDDFSKEYLLQTGQE